MNNKFGGTNNKSDVDDLISIFAITSVMVKAIDFFLTVIGTFNLYFEL